MRTQAITTPFDDSCDPDGWRAESVDPRGWLAGGGAASTLSKATADPTEVPAATERAAARAARRSASARRRRRVRTHTAQRSLLVERAGVNRARKRLALDRPATRAVPSTAVDVGQGEGYRMSRWARLTLTLTALAAVAVVTVSLVVGSVGSAPRTLVDVTVGPGDTLWSIATQAAPDRDPRDVIEEIKVLNDVPGSVLPVGVVLRVPSSAG
jgi:LysM repeat protein